MAKIEIKILHGGDSVLFVNDRIIAVQRENGAVDIIPMDINEEGLPYINMENILTISYGDGVVTTTIDDGNEEIEVTTF
jgi:hypothetical protein